MQYITDYLERNSSKYPDKLALVTSETSLTWNELHQKVVDMASVLPLEHDRQRVVALLLPNSWEFVVAYLAIVHAGHIAMPLDPHYKALEIESLLRQMQPEFSVTDDAHQSVFPSDAKVLNVQNLLQTTASEFTPYRLPADEQIVSLLFTSGTTGKPKTTPYTHKNYLWNIEAVSELWKWTHEDTLLISLPMSHWHGLAMGMVGFLYHGNTMYLQHRFHVVDTLTMLSSGKISLFMHVPIAYLQMTKDASLAEQYDLSKVRLCISGSSYLPPKVWHDFKKMYGHEILERYGASEMGLLTSNTLDSRVPGSVGFPLPGVEIKIRDNGEIALKSGGVFIGYYKNEQATAASTTDDGFWLSSDIGEFAANGRITLKGRVQEKMKKSGYTIYPRDLEWALLKNPAVHDVFVMSQQNAGADGMSDKIIYFVVGDLDEAQIIEYCKAHMPSFWRPDLVKIVDEIPKSIAGKPKLALLRSMV